jgi:4-aminobutyrate aminotransferase-like enzyme
LARELARVTPGELSQSIFGSSGSEAVEAAIKTAIMATGRSGVLAFEGGYHGLALGGSSVPFQETRRLMAFNWHSLGPQLSSIGPQ